MMGLEVIALCLALSLILGVAGARISSRSRERKQVRKRLDFFLDQKTSKGQPVNLLKRRLEAVGNSPSAWFEAKKQNLDQACEMIGWGESTDILLQISMLLFFAPVIVTVGLSFEIIIGLLIGITLSTLPYFVLMIKVANLRRKFTTQLPDAIDLMVSVLRTGHSIPRAIQTVSQEVPSPCGAEFKTVLHRMNLGQPLSEALARSCVRFASYELDLIRRAVAIQMEVGGSLAELLDKTNYTLRQRIKLSRQVNVLTSQSRLTAIIVGLLPVVMAIVLNAVNPGYLDPLFQKDMGKALLLVAVGLQVLGIFLMRKLSTIKV